MSEQVGASLALAQLLMPSATGPATQALPAAGRAGGSLNADILIQPIDSIEETPPAFQSLLTELATLEAGAGANQRLNPEAMIKVRVATAPAAAEQTALPGGSNLPATGKAPLDAGMLPPLLAQPADLPGLPAGNPTSNLPGPSDILIAEPTADTPAQQINSHTSVASEALAATASNLVAASAEPVASTLPSATTSSSPAPAAPAPVLPGSEPMTAQRSDGQPIMAPAAGSSNLASGNDTGDAATGQRHGEPQGDRQAQPVVNGRAPSISFSVDGLPTAALAPGQLTAGSAPATPTVLSQTLTLLGQPGQWAEPLAERLAGLATRGANTAEIRLHPPSLGQLEVRITLANDQASLVVVSANPDVREALQQALPRLDNLLNDLGIELAESEIADRQPEGFAAQAEDTTDEPGDGQAGAEPQRASDDAHRLGVLDTWA